ncbi:MAG: hypothetical protein DMF14_03630 [Verrucomicrobia bacterium]|nr:MAG: hypothetical protein DMF14_03630 [Verrucomicrobiota bacterium]
MILPWMKRRFAVVALLPLCFAPQLVIGQEQSSPLQADVQVRVNHGDRRLVPFRARLEGGEATLRGTVQNLPGGETALVFLRFDYNTEADIALDELIVPLNPNRAPLYYSATLYHPPQNGRSLYLARIQVFGNYE